MGSMYILGKAGLKNNQVIVTYSVKKEVEILCVRWKAFETRAL